MNRSNLNGRLLEFFIVDRILKTNPNCIIDKYSIDDQNRDRNRLKDLEKHLIDRFTISSVQIINWLDKKISIHSVSRLPDSSGKKGDVTDVRITDINGKTINLSIKNNHKAVKHQRPGSLIQQIGILKNSEEDIIYREKLNDIYRDFHNEIEKLKPVPSLFNEVEDLKYPKIYNPVCSLVSQTINKFKDSSILSNHYQKFLIGNTDFYKIIVEKESVDIIKYCNIPSSSRMSSTFSKNYVFLDFHNGIKMIMRLHTASSRITKNISLKFDSQMDEDMKEQIPKEILRF